MSIDYKKLVTESPIIYPSWTHTPQQIKDDMKVLEKEARDLNDKVAKIEDPTVENVLKPWKEFDDSFTRRELVLTFYQDMSTDKALRDAARDAENESRQTWVELLMRRDVYGVLKKLLVKLEADPNADADDLRFLKREVENFERAGLALPDDKFERVKAIKLELGKLLTEFSTNQNEEKDFIEFTLEELDGVPQDTIDGFEKIGDKYRMTYKYPDVIPTMKYAHNQETRKRAFLGSQSKSPQNGPILEKMIKLRFELAKLLGYDTYSNYVLEQRMAKNQTNVLNFLNDLKEKLAPLGKQDLKRMLDFKNKDLKERGLPVQDKLYLWDNAYYNEKLLEKEYLVDNLKVAEYFPLTETLATMFSFYEKIFDIKVVKLSEDELPEGALWHKDAQLFAIYQNVARGEKKNEYMGLLYLDLHPREGKYSHAANFGIDPGHENPDGSRHTPVTVLLCNFTKPTKEKPLLMMHSEVVTMFHELGHGIHNILSKTRYSTHHGTHVERDFVECPSQMLEYWTWLKDELKKLSRHYKTGEPMDDGLIDDLIRTKNVNLGLHNLRQLHFALFDMTLHTKTEEKDIEALDLFKLWNELRFELVGLDDDNNPTPGYASFGHIAGGYESGYYGYLYSNVFALDIYYTLFKQNPMDIDNGIRYRDIVLKRGGSKDSMDNLKELLGREPNAEAFTKEILGN